MPRLVEVGCAFARGDGKVVRCVFHDDSARMLTVGDHGDVPWWDLPKRSLLRRHELPRRVVVAHLHPREAWAVCELDDGSRVRLEMDSGAVAAWTGSLQDHFLRPLDGDWSRDGAPGDDGAVSKNGIHRLVLDDDRLTRVPKRNGHRFQPAPAWLANDGTLLLEEGRGLRAYGLELTDRVALRPPHRSPPQRLVFSPDDRYLAMVGFASVQVVETSGREVAEFPGPCIVHAGQNGDEFWLLTETSLRLWRASSGTFVGSEVRWPDAHLNLERQDHWPRELRCTAIVDGQPWTDKARRAADGSLHDFDFRWPTAAGAGDGAFDHVVAMDAGRAGACPLVLTRVTDTKSSHVRSRLRRLAHDGTTRHAHSIDQPAGWLARGADSQHVFVGTLEGQLQRLREADLTLLASATFDPPLQAAIAVNDQHLLGTDGRQLLRIDAKTLAPIHRFALPAELPAITRLCAAHRADLFAIAHGSEVRILRIE